MSERGKLQKKPATNFLKRRLKKLHVTREQHSTYTTTICLLHNRKQST
jgi:hypothetical protein